MTTLRDLRVRVADKLGEVVVGEATSPIAAPASTFTDVINFNDDKNTFRGADVLITTGPSAGHRARCVSSALNNLTITFSPESPNAINLGDEIQVFGIRRNLRIQQIDRAIREAQADAFPMYRLLHSADVEDVYLPDENPDITLPAEFTHVFSVSYLGLDGNYYDTRPGKPGTGGWHLEPGRKLRITGESRWYANNRTIRVRGYRQEPPLTLDTDETGIDPEWLTVTAALYIRLRQEGQEGMMKAGQIGARADALRAIASTPVAANSRRVIP